jgi:hypothetical protein
VNPAPYSIFDQNAFVKRLIVGRLACYFDRHTWLGSHLLSQIASGWSNALIDKRRFSDHISITLREDA